MKHKILIAEDDINLGEVLNEYLSLKGYESVLCRDGEEGEKIFHQQKFDLCILDLMMPKKDGFELAQEIRKIDTKTPIIFLTAKSMKQDIIKGFTIGGDDYITKPFSMEELLLRLQAILKRTSSPKITLPPSFKVSNLKYYYHKNLLITPKRKIKLTTKENELLKMFFSNFNQTISRSDVLMTVWKNDNYFNARTMDVYLTKIRKFLSDDENIKILTIHGEGFKMIKID